MGTGVVTVKGTRVGQDAVASFAFYRGAIFILMESLMGDIGTLVVLGSSRSCCSRGSAGFYKIIGTSCVVRETQWLFYYYQEDMLG